MGREAKLMVAVGKKGVGKSWRTERLLDQYALGSVKSPPRRGLILDVNDEYINYKPISISQLPLFSVHPTVEIRRIRPFLEEDGAYTKRMTLDDICATLLIILDNYKNGLLLIEDPSRYISDSMPNDLVGAICTNRHINLDIILHYQSIGRITSKVWQNANIIRFHKQTESVKKHMKKFEDKYECLSIMEAMVNKKYMEGDLRFFCYADVETMKIYGSFTDDDFREGVNSFIRQEYSKLVRPLLQYRDDKGKLMYNHQTAQDEVRRTLMMFRKTA